MKLGYIGLGNMGGALARRLLRERPLRAFDLRPEVLGNSTLVERFIREARLAACITSEHVVRIHDVSMLEEAGPYIVMEYLVGNDLSRAVQKGPLPIAAAVDYVLQACDALAEAHARIRASGRDIRLEIDGGVKVENAAEIARAGADTFVSGSAIFGSGDYARTITAMRAQIEEGLKAP